MTVKPKVYTGILRGGRVTGVPAKSSGEVAADLIAMGWHCFSFHCKYAEDEQSSTFCGKHEKRCHLDNCEVFRNGRPV